MRPLPEFQRSSKAQPASGEGAARRGNSDTTAHGVSQREGEAQEQDMHDLPDSTREGRQGMEVDEELAQGLSRLSMAADTAAVPQSIAFGRRRGGRGMPGLGAKIRGGRSGRGNSAMV